MMKKYILLSIFFLGFCAQNVAQVSSAYRDKLGNKTKKEYAFNGQKTLNKSVKDKYGTIWSKSSKKVQQWAKKQAQKADMKPIRIAYSPSGQRFTTLSKKQQHLLRFMVVMESYTLLSNRLNKYSSKKLQNANKRLYHELVQIRDERAKQAEEEGGKISKKDADTSNAILSKI